METGLRVFLLILSAFIIFGIIWDYRHGRHLKRGLFGFKRRGASVRSRKVKAQSDVLFSDTEDEDYSDDMKSHAFAAATRRAIANDSDVMIEETFDEVVLQNEKADPKIRDREKASARHSDPVVLYIMAKRNQGFSGQRLMQIFKDEHLLHGDQKIFHRFEPGSDNPVFSIASAVEPGYFEPSEMRQFITPGIVLFFDAAQSDTVLQDFDLMLRVARRLTSYLDGELKDERHRDLTIQVLEHYQNRLKSKTASMSG